MTFKPAPFLTPEDLGIDIEVDSEDVTETEFLEAVETDSSGDFVVRAKRMVESLGGGPYSFELKRKGGILYSKMIYNDGNNVTFFKVEWLRKP
jgi:hypothetical protein